MTDRQERERKEALLQLLQSSVRLGHRRLTIRRVLMLQICGIEVPTELRAHCEHVLAKARTAEVDAIRQSVMSWARMVAMDGKAERTIPPRGHVSDSTEAPEGDAAALEEANGPPMTQWRFPGAVRGPAWWDSNQGLSAQQVAATNE